MTTYGLTPAGFVRKPLAVILSEMQAQIWATIDPAMDLSPQSADGKLLAIHAADADQAWGLLEIAYNQYDRTEVEGAGADNLGDLTGSPREGESYTQVSVNLTIAPGTYAAGALVANVFGSPAQTFTNAAAVTPAMISGAGVAEGILFQSTVPGETPAVAPGTLTAITGPVTGWTAVTNPEEQSQLGANQEPDAFYLPRQAAEVAGEGASSAGALVAQLQDLGAAQSPPQNLSVTVLESTSRLPTTLGAVVLPPHSFSVFVYDGGTGWAIGPGQAAIGQVIYQNKPAGIASVGAIPVAVVDPILGNQVVFFSVPTSVPVFIAATVVPRPGVDGALLVEAIQSALVAAAVAPNLIGGVPPLGQLAPGARVVGQQLEAVMMRVPGVLEVYGPGAEGTPIALGFNPAPTLTLPLKTTAAQVATISAGTVETNVVLTLADA